MQALSLVACGLESQQLNKAMAEGLERFQDFDLYRWTAGEPLPPPRTQTAENPPGDRGGNHHAVGHDFSELAVADVIRWLAYRRHPRNRQRFAATSAATGAIRGKAAATLAALAVNVLKDARSKHVPWRSLFRQAFTPCQCATACCGIDGRSCQRHER